MLISGKMWILAALLLLAVNGENHYCPVKSRRESTGWRFRQNWRPGR